MKKIIFSLFILTLFISCNTTEDLEKKLDDENFSFDENTEDVEEFLQNDEVNGKFTVIENLNNEEPNDNIVIVERPVYVPESKASKTDKGKVTGKDASVQSLKEAIQKPEQYKSGTFVYSFNENWVYEIYAQPLHLTDIILEPGEIIIGKPMLSEDESVWELAAAVGVDPETGLDVQHLFVKPAYSKLDSTLIIITNRRVYHFNLKSYSDTYMAMVKFKYQFYQNEYVKPKEKINEDTTYIKTSNPAFLSFDYTVSYNKKKKPMWVPTLVYDDGAFTYVQLDEQVLQTKLPVIFNEKNEIINYEVKNNVLIIPRLITKISLRIEKEKVIVEKKRNKEK
jgi:type IV secretion system protein VirB9